MPAQNTPSKVGLAVSDPEAKSKTRFVLLMFSFSYVFLLVPCFFLMVLFGSDSHDLAPESEPWLTLLFVNLYAFPAVSLLGLSAGWFLHGKTNYKPAFIAASVPAMCVFAVIAALFGLW